MNSSGSSLSNSSSSDISFRFSDNSDISDSTGDFSDAAGDVFFEEIQIRSKKLRKGRTRRQSVASVSTNPEEEAYVMVLQNRCDLYDDKIPMISSTGSHDITFIVGTEKKPVHAIRDVIATRGRMLYLHILSCEENTQALKKAKRSPLKKTFAKLNKLSCVKPDDEVFQELKIPMETFDPESFQRLMNFIHCGTLTVDASTVIGLLNAGYMFGFPEIQQACWDFALGCVIREDNLRDMLMSARRYSDQTMTQKLMSTMHQYAHDYKDCFSHSHALQEIAHEIFQQRPTQDAETSVT